ncbi:GNAT family N-acetyltransferase [Peribacillus kribbensis]|uniref:GNAT family N-acetyltransferase n=1 Tax=Peribacillus kribbensis TaxID=356658 RepID=UPI0004275990|nr:GNAT family N-acetyltransferase [Peribacillus kribbensis]
MQKIIEAERIYLRSFGLGDVEDLHEILGDKETMSHYPSQFTKDDTLQWILRNQNRYKRDGYGLWAVCLKSSDALIGDCGLVKQEVSGREEVELGFHIHKNYWRKGFASEAGSASKDFAWKLGLKRLISIIAPENEASKKTAEKIGLRLEIQEFVFGRPHLIYQCGRQENIFCEK